MHKNPSEKNHRKAKVATIGSCLLLSIITMSIASFAWFTQFQPGTDKVTLTSDENSVLVDAYAYKPGYATDGNGDPVEAAHSDHSSTPLLAATKTNGAGSATYTVTFNSDTLSTFSYGSLYGDELYQDEKAFPHVYIELRYVKPLLNGFVKATVANIDYAADIAGYTNITSYLGYEYRTITQQNTSTSKRISGFTAAYADADYPTSPWTSITDSTPDFSLYDASSDISGYSYGASYVMEKQCFVPSFPYQYATDEYYYSKATFLEFRVNPLSWMDYFKNHTTSNSSSSAAYSLGALNFGVSFDLELSFSNTPYYDTAASTSPRLAVSSSLVNMKPLTTNDSITVSNYNFTSAPTYTVNAANDSLVSGTIVGGTLHLSSTSLTGTTTVTITGTYGTETASALVTVRISGPTLSLSVSSISIKMGGVGSVVATTYNFSGPVTIGAESHDTNVATVAMSGTSVTITPVAVGSTSMTVSATDGTTTKTAECSIIITSPDKTLVSIAVTSLPDTTSYVIGSVLDTTGCVITATWSDTSTTLVSSSCSFAPTDLDTVGTQTITVSYGGQTTSFSVVVTEAGFGTTFQLITSDSDLVSGTHYVVATPVYNYALGTTSGNTGYNNRTAMPVTIAGDGTLTTTETTDILTLESSGTNWTMYSNDGTTTGYLYAASSTSNYLKTEPEIGSDTNALWSIGVASSGIATIVAQGANTHNILRYNGSSTLFSCYAAGNSQYDVYLYKEVVTTTKTLTSISLKNEPTNTIYVVGQTLNTSGLAITANYSDGTTTTPTNFTTSPVNGTVLSTEGEQLVTVSYTEGTVTKTTLFSINVNPAPTSISVTTLPTTTTYSAGEAFSTAGMVVKANYSSGDPEIITSYTTSPANGATLTTSGTVTVTVTYGTLTTNFTITVTAAPISISVTTLPTTTTYNVGDAFSTSGMVVQANYSSGNPEVITNYTTSPANGDTLSSSGTITVTVTYGSLSTTFNITVNGGNPNNYTLVTSDSGLVANATYLIYATNGTAHVVMNSTWSTTYYGYVTAVPSNNVITFATGMLPITLGGSSGAWTLRDTVNNGYIYASAAKSIKFGAVANTWTVSINPTTYVATITYSTISYGTLQYNALSPRFTTYTSAQTSVYLYKQG